MPHRACVRHRGRHRIKSLKGAAVFDILAAFVLELQPGAQFLAGLEAQAWGSRVGRAPGCGLRCPEAMKCCTGNGPIRSPPGASSQSVALVSAAGGPEVSSIMYRFLVGGAASPGAPIPIR